MRHRPAHSVVILALICLLCRALPARSAPLQPGAEQVKSAIILNMARYVEWPTEALGSETTQFSICSLGRGAFANALEGLQGKMIKGHRVTVRSMSGSTDLAGCHLVVVVTDDRRQIAPLLEKVRRQPVLTVGDLAGFNQIGGMVELYLQEGKIRFDINLAPTRHNRLKVSSQLLKVARTVHGGE